MNFNATNKERLYMAEQYYKAFLNMIEPMIKTGSPNFMVSDEEVSDETFEEHIRYSACSVILPMLFCFYQYIELALKAFVYHKDNNNMKFVHDTYCLFNKFEDLYLEEVEIIQTLQFYLSNDKLGFINSFCMRNNIKTTTQLYNSLRYPDSNNIREYGFLKIGSEESFVPELEKMKKDVNLIQYGFSRLFRELENNSQ